MNRFLYILLYPLYLVYLLIISIRNFLYNKQFLKISKLPCRIISVGNISMGGTGKTPTVISLAQQLQQNYKVAILSRGYGRKTKGTQLVTDGKSKNIDWKLVGDEPALMANILSDIPIVVDEDRDRGGKYIIENFSPDVIILDDAFQHRRIYRDYDIVLIDASKSICGSFNREPFSSIKRADLILLNKGNSKSVKQLENNLSTKYNIPVHETKTITGDFIIDQNGNTIKIDDIQNKPALIFSGIGNNISFYDTVKQVGIKIVQSMEFKDHHNYSESDLKTIEQEFKRTNADTILTTEKDLIKLPRIDLPIFAIPIKMVIPPETIDFIAKN